MSIQTRHCDFLTVRKVPVRSDYIRMKFMPRWSICHKIYLISKKDGEYIFFLKNILVLPCIIQGWVQAIEKLRVWREIYSTSLKVAPDSNPDRLSTPACHCRSLAKCFVKDTIFERATTWMANLKMLITFDTFLELWQIWWQIDQPGINFIMIWSDLTGTFLTVRKSQCKIREEDYVLWYGEIERMANRHY